MFSRTISNTATYQRTLPLGMLETVHPWHVSGHRFLKAPDVAS